MQRIYREGVQFILDVLDLLLHRLSLGHWILFSQVAGFDDLLPVFFERQASFRRHGGCSVKAERPVFPAAPSSRA